MGILHDLCDHVIRSGGRKNSNGPRIKRIYVCDDEYKAVIAEAEDAADQAMGSTPWGEERRVAVAFAEIYRLSEIQRHMAIEAEMRAEGWI